MVRKIRASGRMLLSLISDVLDVSKIEAGQMVIEQAPFRLADVIDNLSVVLGVAVGQKNIELIIQPPPAGVLTLIGDALRLEQVLINLSINAIKFTHAGQVELRTELLYRDRGQTLLRFTVRDTGIGIAPELKEGVFAAFTQADSSTTRRFGGTGLGLTICRQLVHLMGGEIGLVSVLGKGSEFWFTVPLKTVADADSTVSNSVREETLIAGQSLQGIRVLVVDDSEINREVASRILQGQGAIVELANDGQAALDWLQAHAEAVDLVLMDVQMPVMDGIEATRRLRRIPRFAELPIIALTAGAFKSQHDDAAAAGMSHFISKPFDVPSTIALIQRLSHRAMSGPGGEMPMADALSLGAAVPVDASKVVAMDVAQGVKQWLGRASYQEYLQLFVDLHRHTVGAMNHSLAQGNLPEAQSIAHKLSGVAANLALPEVRRLASQVEQSLVNGLDPTVALLDLDGAMQAVLIEIEHYLSSPE
jgi:CheY-like chemotaxis protein